MFADISKLMWSDTLKLDAPYVSAGETFGGPGGQSFDMMEKITDPFKSRLKSITVRSCARIDAIEVSTMLERQKNSQ